MTPAPGPVLALIHAFEKGPNGSFASTPYKDPSGKDTIGWGHKIKPGEAFPNPLSEQDADDLALSDATTAAIGVSEALTPTVLAGLTDNQYGALIDFTFNEGVAAFRGSHLCMCVNNGAMHLVPDEFMKWIYEHVDGAPVVENGLVNRRKAEVQVWLL